MDDHGPTIQREHRGATSPARATLLGGVALVISVIALVVALIALSRASEAPGNGGEDATGAVTTPTTAPPDQHTEDDATQAPSMTDSGRVVRVPGDHDSIQDAIDTASDGDTIIVARGTYTEELEIDVSITLASAFIETGDRADVEATIIRTEGTAIETTRRANPGVRVVGLSLIGGEDADDGISSESAVTLEDSLVIGFADGVDTQNKEGELFTALRNEFRDQRDDPIDLDDATSAHIEGNVFVNADQDGIEIRLYDFDGPLDIVIRGNLFDGTGEDGIQFIEQAGDQLSDRRVVIEQNVFRNIGFAALGFLDNADTDQDFRAADVDDPVLFRNNTIIGTDYGISGGDNVVAVNNLISGFTGVAFWGVDGASVVAHNLVFGEGTPHDESNVDEATILLADPRLDGDGRPLPDSPAIDAGVATFDRDGQRAFEVGGDSYAGAAPDLGAYEAP